jgi:ferric-dicitrate binding protein FerR (iron transport regulator)
MSDDHEPQTPTLELVERYVVGALQPDEAAQVSAYLATHPSAAAALDALRRSVDLRGQGGDANQRWAELAARIGTQFTGAATETRGDGSRVRRPARPGGPSEAKGRFGVRLWRRIAIAGAVVAASTVLYAAVMTGHRGETTLQRYATRVGEVMTVRLADGTRIVLAPQTSLTVAQGFGPRHREVTVAGMARFDVASAAGAPFTVRSGHVATQVLGTTFSVRHYADERDVVVAVASGKVVVRSVGAHVLGANMLARFEDSTVLVSSDADLREYMEWASGRLVFNEAPVEEVMATLGRWYGLEFRFADSTIAKQHVTGSFRSDARQEVLQTVQLMLGVRMVFDGNVVTLVPGRPAAAPPRVPRALEVIPPSHMEVGR